MLNRTEKMWYTLLKRWWWMYRFAIESLLQWKEKENRKPLLLMGARQVGKTWLMKEFGKKYYDKVVKFESIFWEISSRKSSTIFIKKVYWSGLDGKYSIICGLQFMIYSTPKSRCFASVALCVIWFCRSQIRYRRTGSPALRICDIIIIREKYKETKSWT